MRTKDRIESLERTVGKLKNGIEELEYREKKNQFNMYNQVTGTKARTLNPNVALRLILEHLGLEIRHSESVSEMAGYTIVPKEEQKDE